MIDDLEYAVVGTAQGLRSLLKKSDSAVKLLHQLNTGVITTEAIAKCIQRFEEDFKSGFCFPYEQELSLFAVVLEEYDSAFSWQYLKELSGLEIVEMSMCRRVAKICLDKKLSKHP